MTMDMTTEMTTEEKKLPGYLLDAPKNGHIYGTLSYNRRSKCWTIKGEPCVAEMAARLFPGSERRRRRGAVHGEPAHHRRCELADAALSAGNRAARPRALGERAGAGAGARAFCATQRRRSGPRRSAPPEGTFEGELREFQKEGLVLPAGRHPAGAAWRMRWALGKTVQALACLAAAGAFPALIVVPPHLPRNWQAEAARFLRIGGQAGARLRADGLEAVSAAGGGRLHHSLSAAARLEAGAAADGVQARSIFDEIPGACATAARRSVQAASLLAEELRTGDRAVRHADLQQGVGNLERGQHPGLSIAWAIGRASRARGATAMETIWCATRRCWASDLRREGLILRRTKEEVLADVAAEAADWCRRSTRTTSVYLGS